MMGDANGREVAIRLEDISLGEANIIIEDLCERLRGAIPNTTIRRRRDDPTTQDFGATAVLILGAPAIVAVAEGIRTWMRRWRTGRVTIEAGDGKLKIIGDHLTTAQIAEVLRGAVAAAHAVSG